MSGALDVRIVDAGDSALMLELGPRCASPHIDLELCARLAGVARAVRARSMAGVRDVVSTYRTVVVSFDPLATDVERLAALLRESSAAAPVVGGAMHEVPASYGGADGPDLDEVAAFARCSPDEVIDRHTSRTYRVCMLGFLPGFAYLGSVEDRIAAPRRATPRVRVPAGSVGIAGQQTGIYPMESPGGWQIIGRAGVSLFDPHRTPVSLFSAGDEVRFVPVSPDAMPSRKEPPAPGGPAAVAGGPRTVTVLRPGLLTTIQDSGRWGHQAAGVPVAGPMDQVAHRLANLLVGNPAAAATIEVTVLGPELRMEQATDIALAGADLGARLDDVDLPVNVCVTCGPGSVLRFGERRSGVRSYVAFGGGVLVPPLLGSRSTHVRSGLGGVDGRALRAGDRLPLGQSGGVRRRPPDSWPMPPVDGARLRMVRGPHDHLVPSALEALLRTRYTVSSEADRMGYRLTGSTHSGSVGAGDMLSDVAFTGGVQITPSGAPILLMTDRPTTGGYPQVGVVITADLPLAAQLTTGNWVEFDLCTRPQAIAALVAQESRLLAVG